ncbi:hypothetical protein N0V93_005980 [Gnomoniopsis smithogilvyi]|uniref:Uncharacterized protein n=1 Tax=Gnomoniopsis smithogilvyi TaxID=1191159 RepID=A0A9W9CVA1_9PEZI|nr:hypothetical protein N0V93_005980 [Gnomoniopsis smithogilvyi]
MSRSSTTGERAPFLNDEESCGQLKEADGEHPVFAAPSRRDRLSWFGYCFHAGMLIINIAWFAANVLNSPPAPILNSTTGNDKPLKLIKGPGPIFMEPLDAPIEYNTIRWTLPIGKRSAFTSFDREVADEAWSTRGVSANQGWLKIPKEDLAGMNETSVEFKDGKGSLLAMDVFHQLHCLNYIRKKMDPYKDSYPIIEEDAQIHPLYHIRE